MIERERLFIYSLWIERHRCSHVVRRGFELMVGRAQDSSHTHKYTHWPSNNKVIEQFGENLSVF
jgi:hypothetical protein